MITGSSVRLGLINYIAKVRFNFSKVLNFGKVDKK